MRAPPPVVVAALALCALPFTSTRAVQAAAQEADEEERTSVRG